MGRVHLVTPKDLFDLFSALPDEDRIAFLRLMGRGATFHVPLLIASELSPLQSKAFLDKVLDGIMGTLRPVLIRHARELARDRPDLADADFDKELETQFIRAMEGFARTVGRQEREKLKGERDRKSDPATISRNVEICALRTLNAKLWTHARLGKKYGLTPQMIRKVLANEPKWRRLAGG